MDRANGYLVDKSCCAIQITAPNLVVALVIWGWEGPWRARTGAVFAGALRGWELLFRGRSSWFPICVAANPTNPLVKIGDIHIGKTEFVGMPFVLRTSVRIAGLRSEILVENRLRATQSAPRAESKKVAKT